MRSYLYLLTASILSFASAVHAATHTVTTADNSSGPNDGVLSLLEAIQAAGPGDTIGFRLPGEGPHLLETPLGGYPFITVDHLTIDGYTQPGSLPNTARFEDGNNAQIRIVLDSRAEDFLESRHPDQPELLVRRSTRMLNADGSDISGFGATENGILAVMGAQNFVVRGLCFLGRHTVGSKSDPLIYAVALAKASENARVQGCWFGLHPDRSTIAACRSAVAAFRFNEVVEGQTVGRASAGLVFGTDGDGANDRAERNLSVGMSLALALELPGARISGNLFNVFPDGATFLDIREYALANGLGTIETFENGRFRENTLVGTNGDGLSDEDERNVFGPSLYDHIFEFYGGNAGTNVVIAGNHFGVGAATANGWVLYPHDPAGAPDFLQMTGAGDVRIGTNGDGLNDALEANLIYGLGGDQLVDAGSTVPVVARGNWLQGNGFVGFPFQHRDKGRAYETYFADALAGPLSTETDAVPYLLDTFDGFFTGVVPVPNLDRYPFSFVDVYLLDLDALQQGFVVPGRPLATFVEGSTQDRHEGASEFRFTLSAFDAPAGSELVAVVTYSKFSNRTESGSALTGPVSGLVTLAAAAVAAPQPVGGTHLGIRDSGPAVELSWLAPEGLFLLETMDDLSTATWRPVPGKTDADPVRGNTLLLPKESGSRFYRLRTR
jgi:hypothetical protein